MALAIVVIPSAVLCNLIWLSSIAAGRSTLTWRRRLWTALAFLLFALAGLIITTFAPPALHAETRSAIKGAVAIASVLSIVFGTLLTFLEYVVTGRGVRFRPNADLEAVSKALRDSPPSDQR